MVGATALAVVARGWPIKLPVWLAVLLIPVSIALLWFCDTTPHEEKTKPKIVWIIILFLIAAGLIGMVVYLPY